MAEKTQYRKVASLAVKDGTYVKDGKERNHYQNVGHIYSSPHGSHMFVKLNATATSEPRLLNIFAEEGVEISVEQPVQAEEVPDF